MSSYVLSTPNRSGVYVLVTNCLELVITNVSFLPLEIDKRPLYSCGIGGAVGVNVTYQDGRQCVGTLTDWNNIQCSHVMKLKFFSSDCKKEEKG